MASRIASRLLLTTLLAMAATAAVAEANTTTSGRPRPARDTTEHDRGDAREGQVTRQTEAGFARLAARKARGTARRPGVRQRMLGIDGAHRAGHVLHMETDGTVTFGGHAFEDGNPEHMAPHLALTLDGGGLVDAFDYACRLECDVRVPLHALPGATLRVTPAGQLTLETTGSVDAARPIARAVAGQAEIHAMTHVDNPRSISVPVPRVVQVPAR